MKFHLIHSSILYLIINSYYHCFIYSVASEISFNCYQSENFTKTLCRLSNSSSNINLSNLQFYRNQEPIFTKVINETTILANVSDSKNNSMQTFKFLDTSCSDDDQYIGVKSFIITNFTCEFLNFLGGKCSFSLNDSLPIKQQELWSWNNWRNLEMKNITHFAKKVKRDVGQRYEFQVRKHPGVADNREDFYSGSIRFFHFAFQVNGTNADGQKFCQRATFYGPKYTKLSPPKEAIIRKSTNDSVTFSYQLSSDLPSTFKKNYNYSHTCHKDGSTGNDIFCYVFHIKIRACGKFERDEIFYFDESKNITLKDLPFANTEYTAEIRMKLDRSIYLSDPLTFSFTTGEDIPKLSPKQLTYNRISSDLYILWTPLDKFEEGGRGFHYKVLVNNPWQNNNCTDKKFIIICRNFTLPRNLEIQIQSANRMGVSHDISTFHIPAEISQIEDTIFVEHDYDVDKKKHSLKIKNDTIIPSKIVWCETRTFKPNQCESPINYVNYTDWTGTVPTNKSIMFGITLDSSNSSRIIWSTCKQSSNLIKVKDFKVLLKNEKTIELKWLASCEHEEIQYDYLLSCKCSFLYSNLSNQECTCPGRTVIPKKEVSYTITDFKAYSHYIFTISMMDQWNNTSEASSEAINTIESSPSEVNKIKTNVTSTSLTLSWKPPLFSNGILWGYKVIVHEIREENRKLHIISSGATNYTVNELKSNTEYNFCIEACNRNGRLCSKCQYQLFKTKEGVPEKVILNTTNCLERFTWNVTMKPHFFEVDIDGKVERTVDFRWDRDSLKTRNLRKASVRGVNVRLTEEECKYQDLKLQDFLKNGVCTEERCIYGEKTTCNIQQVYHGKKVITSVMLFSSTSAILLFILIAYKYISKKLDVDFHYPQPIKVKLEKIDKENKNNFMKK